MACVTGEDAQERARRTCSLSSCDADAQLSPDAVGAAWLDKSVLADTLLTSNLQSERDASRAAIRAALML
jgi:hypothetical protein